MKIIIIIILVAIKGNALNAQVADTAVYIKQIIDNKSNYIGKPFSALEKDLKIVIKGFCPYSDITWDITKETSTAIWFIKPVTDEGFSEPRLIIYWQLPLNAKKSDTLFTKTDGGHWASEVDSFYSGGIIRDISYLGQQVDHEGGLLKMKN